MFVPRKDALPGARHPVEHPSPSSDMWRPIDTAPKDGTWILGMNNRGNAAVIIWSEHAHDRGELVPGWIHPFSMGDLSSFWNGACGSKAEYWMPIAAHPRKAAAPPQAPVAGSEDSASEVAG